MRSKRTPKEKPSCTASCCPPDLPSTTSQQQGNSLLPTHSSEESDNNLVSESYTQKHKPHKQKKGVGKRSVRQTMSHKVSPPSSDSESEESESGTLSNSTKKQVIGPQKRKTNKQKKGTSKKSRKNSADHEILSTSTDSESGSESEENINTIQHYKKKQGTRKVNKKQYKESQKSQTKTHRAWFFKPIRPIIGF